MLSEQAIATGSGNDSGGGGAFTGGVTDDVTDLGSSGKYKNSPQACTIWRYFKMKNNKKISFVISGQALTSLELSSGYTIEYKLAAGMQDKCVSGGSQSCSEVIGFWNNIFGNTGDCVPNQI